MKTHQEIAQPLESFVNRMLSHYGIAVIIKDEQTKKNIIEDLRQCSALTEMVTFWLEGCLQKPWRVQVATTIEQFTFVDECNLHKNGCNVVEKGTWNEFKFNDVLEAFSSISRRAAKTYGYEEFAA